MELVAACTTRAPRSKVRNGSNGFQKHSQQYAGSKLCADATICSLLTLMQLLLVRYVPR